MVIVVVEDEPPTPYGKRREIWSPSVSPYSASSSGAVPMTTPDRRSWHPDWSAMPIATPPRGRVLMPRTPELFQPTSPSGSLLLCWLPDWSAMPTPSPPSSRPSNLALRPFRLAWLPQAIPGSKPRPEAIRRQPDDKKIEGQAK